MPRWAVFLLNQQFAIQVELATLQHCLIDKRHLLTERELAESRALINAAAQRAFAERMEQLDRQLAQRPTAYGEPDPRRAS